VKGALIELVETSLAPQPSVIVFQYNPETLARDLKPWFAEAGGAGAENAQAREQPTDPEETFKLELVLDAADDLEEPDSHPVAVLSGVADRIAKLEMLLYPSEPGLLSQGIGRVLGKEVVPRNEVPVLLFVWGPGRVVPVRITDFSVQEQAFSPTLYPIRATVSIGLRVLTPESFAAGRSGTSPEEKLSLSEQIAIKAYEYTRLQKKLLVGAGSLQSVASAFGGAPGGSQVARLLGP
jgi:hypothetical protein